MKKRSKIAAAAVMILLAAALVYSVCAGTVTVAGLLGAADIDPVKVERIEFIKTARHSKFGAAKITACEKAYAIFSITRIA